MKKPWGELENMSPLERRDFLKYVTGFLALPIVSPLIRDAMLEILLGPQAEAQAAGNMNFIECNFRDQWDFGSIFVAPSLARSYENIKSQLALFDTPIQERNGFYLTQQAQELRPHLDDIAVLELGECNLSGDKSVHGHEAGNPMRSPGRSQQGGNGRFDMASVDKAPGQSGNEYLYSSTPTPLILHNYYNKSITPGLGNGVIMRSSIRTGTHTYYHFEAGLANAQVDRFFDRNTFINRFRGSVSAPSSHLQKHGALVAKLLKRIDDSYLKRAVAHATKVTQHAAKTDSVAALFAATPPPSFNVELSAQELAAWKQGIADQVVCDGDDANNCVAKNGRWHVGEIFGQATKLIQAGRVRSIGIDFDMHDIHTGRTPFVMSTQCQQSGITLARMIAALKSSGHWNNTIIAMYTLDGSRAPIRGGSTGTDPGGGTKNALVLAGGKVKGGYYGDIQVTGNGTITYRRPDDNGVAIAGGTTGRDQRVPASDIYKTVATLAGVPMSLIDSFPDAKPGKLLRYMIK